MTAGNGRGRPGKGDPMNPDEKFNPSITSPADNMPMYEAKAGAIIRVNRSRTVEARCVDCSAFFGSTGPAASHARSARHRIEIDYRSRFVFAPIELLDRAR